MFHSVGMWIREECSIDELAARLHAWRFNRESLIEVLPHALPRMETLSDFAPLTAFLAAGMLVVDRAKYEQLSLSEDQLKQVLQFSLWRLEELRDWQRDQIFLELKTLANGLELKVKDFLAPLFLSVSGTTASFSVMDAMVLLGPDMTRARLRHTLQRVCGEIGKKQLKKLEKAYQSLT